MNRNKINSFILLVISTCAINQASASSFSTKDSLGCVPLVTKFKSTVSNAKSWNWNFGNGNTSTAQNPTEVFINGGDYTVTLEVEKNDGTSIKIVKANFIKAINEPTIVAVVSDSNLCQNSNYVQLKNNTQGTNHFLWDFGDGKFSETTSPLHHFSSPGDYTINVIATNSYGCSSNKKIGNINIQEMPNRVIQIISQNTSCDSSSLFEFKTLFFEKNEYLWKFDDLSDLTGNQITKVFSGYGKQNVTLITKNSSGCLDTTLLDPIIDIKKSNYNIDVSSEKECKGNSIDFNMNGVNIEKVEWSFSDGHKGFGKSISRDFSINGKYNLTATVTSLSGCLTKISRNNIVEIGNGPNASFHLKDSAICLGSELALSQSANLYSSIMWDFGDGQFSQEKRPKHTYDKKGQFSIKLIVKMGTCADTISKKIMVSKPKASFTNKGIYACAPVDVQFKNTSTDSKKHQWIFSNGISSNKPNPKVKFLHAKNYNATLIAMDSYGCADTLILDSVVKIVNNAPNNFKHTTVRGCAPLSFLLANFSTGTKEWTWDFGDGHFSEKSIPEHTYSSSGDYVVSLSTRNASGCAFTIDTIAVVKSQNIKLDSLEISMNCDENILSATIKCEECKNLNWNVEDSIYNSEEIKHHFANADSNLITISGKSSLGCMTKASYLIKADSCSVQQIIEPQIVTGNANPPLWIKNKNDTLLNSPDFYKGCRPLKTITINPRPDADWWLWDFGDGNTSTQKNPIHEYNSIGSFSLTLFYSQLGIKDTLYLNNFANVHGHENNIQVTSSEHCFDLKLQMQASDPSLMDYSWMIDDKIQSSSSYKIDTLFKNSTQVHIVTVTTSDTNYCNFSKSLAIVASNALPLFQFRNKICHGDSTVIEHNIQNKYTLKWSFGDGNTSTEFDVGHKYENHGEYLIELEMTDKAGCIQKITVGKVLVIKTNAEFSIPGSINVCVGDTLELISERNNNQLRSWSVVNASMISTGEKPLILADSEGVIDITLRVNENGCADSTVKKTIVIVNTPIANFSYSQTSLCFPINTKFTNLSKKGIGYFWDFGDGSSSLEKHPKHQYESSSNRKITLTTTDNFGCKDTKSMVGVDFFHSEINISNDIGCVRAPIEFSESSKKAISWHWDFGDGKTDTSKTPIHNYIDTGFFDITLITRSADGCVDTSYLKNAIEVDQVIANYSVTAETGCAPQPVYFNDESINCTSWHWDFANGNRSSEQNPKQIYYTGGTYNVTLIVSNENGCIDSTKLDAPVKIKGPTAAFSVNKTNICFNDSASFINQSKNASFYTWILGDGHIDSTKHLTYLYQDTGSYKVMLLAIDSIGCRNMTSGQNEISIINIPNKDFWMSDSLGCSPLIVNYKAHDNKASHQWFVDDSLHSTSSSFSETFIAGSTNIKLVVNNEYNCVDSLTKKITLEDAINISIKDVCQNQDTLFLDPNDKSGTWFLDDKILNSGYVKVNSLQTGAHQLIYKSTGVCSFIDTSVFKIDSLIEAKITPINSLCINSKALNLSESSNEGIWSGIGITDPYNGIFDPKYANLGENIIRLTINNGKCQSVDSSAIKVKLKPNANFTLGSKTICEGERLNISIPDNDQGTDYFWTFSNDTDTVLSTKKEPIDILKGSDWNLKLNVSIDGCNDSSQIKNIKVIDLIPPHSPSIIRSTVENNISILTQWEVPEYGLDKIDKLEIWRSADSVNFTQVATKSKSATSYLDEDVDVQNTNYYYLIIPTNRCKVNPEKTIMSSSILLTEKSINSNETKFTWTKYYKWDNGVEYYELQRKDENDNWIIIKSVDGKTHETIIKK